MYKRRPAEPGESSAVLLDPVPLPTGVRVHYIKEFGVAPNSGHGGHHYLIAALCFQFDPLFYPLHGYSSENKTWTPIQLPNPCPEIDRVSTCKVVTIEEGVTAWVDFGHGMLMINLHEETKPSARYLPLPDPLPKNFNEIVNEFGSGPWARRFRDLACVDGVLKLVEMEHRVRVVTETPPAPREKDKLHDSDLIAMSRKRKRGEVKVFDASDITLDGSVHSSLLRGLKGVAAADDDKVAFKDLYSAYPTLSAEGDDVLYLWSTTNFNDPDGWMVAVDLATKRVKAIAGRNKA
nr:unnamed protein product [Digitaria exilis]